MLGNRNRHSLNVREHIVIRESNYTPTLPLEKPLTRAIVSVLVIVIPTIDFNDEFLSDTGKVCKERTDRILPAEFQATQALRSNRIPKVAFGRSLTLTKFSGANCGWIRRHI